MSKIVMSPAAEHHTVRPEQTRGPDFRLGRPPRRSIGHDILGFPCPPHRHGDCADDRSETAGGGDDRPLEEDPVFIKRRIEAAIRTR